jgi:Arc/MetJ family transcription regulator
VVERLLSEKLGSSESRAKRRNQPASVRFRSSRPRASSAVELSGLVQNFTDGFWAAYAGSVDRYTNTCHPYTSETSGQMRTNIDIDDRLMRQAIRSSGAATKRAVVEEGLRLLIATRGQRTIRRLRGRMAWEGDLERSRRGRAAK